MSPDGSYIVYSSPATGHGDIYRIRVDGSGRVRLTTASSYEGSPVYSFDGMHICFVREEKGLAHIWIMDADGGNQKQLTNTRYSDEDPSFSHDCRRIVFCRRFHDALLGSPASKAEICLINADGTEAERLTQNDDADFQPAFAPGDNAVIYSAWSEDIRTLSLDTRLSHSVTKGSSPSIGRDPNRIVYVGGGRGREIRLAKITPRSTQLLYKGEHYLSSPSFCRNDSHVLFLEEPTANGMGKVYLLNLETGEKTFAFDIGLEVELKKP